LLLNMSTAKSWLAAAAAPVRAAERGELILHTPWHFSYMRRGAANTYASSIKEIASFATVEHFWNVYNHLQRPGHLDPPTDLFLFRRGVQPMWEDEANAAGGRLSLRLRKGYASRAFEDLALCAIGEQFELPDFVCGITCSVRFQDDVLSIWVRAADNPQAIAAVASTAKRSIELPASSQAREFEFKAWNLS
jgi:translation initiation factor 4E